jgi:hypothetical protein
MFKKFFIVVLDIIVYNKEDKVEEKNRGNSG